MTEQTVTYSVAAVFTVWFVLTVIYQIRPLAAKVGRYDRLGLLPRWTFFAPNPGIFDHHIIYRESNSPVDIAELKAGNCEGVSDWRQLDGLCSGHNIPLVWNPQRRVTKTITDVVNSIVTARNVFKDRPNLIQFTIEYFLLLHLVQREARKGALCQFAIIRSHGFVGERTPGLVFISNFHRVGE